MPTFRSLLRPVAARRRNERGAVLVLTALAMTAMMCFAALAIDMGNVRAMRAQYQSVADASALYATFLIRQPGATVDGVAAKVRVFVANNLKLDGGISDDAWRNCSDPRALAAVATQDAHIHNSCISFRVSAASQARVRLPTYSVKPAIGLGVVSIPVTAVAGAEGSGSGCDTFQVGGCTATTTTSPPTTLAPTTTTPWTTTTTTPRVTTTTRPVSPTTTRPASPATTRPRATTTTTPRVTTTTAPRATTVAPPTTTPTTLAPTTTRPPTPTTIDIGF